MHDLASFGCGGSNFIFEGEPALKPISTKSSLSQPRQRLIELFQNVNFGKVDLRICGGEPIFDPHPRVVETRKLAAENGPRSESNLEDFSLKQSLIELFQTMDEVNDGTVLITLKHGLPFTCEVERTSRR